jgi:hypothetical protein
MKNQLDPLLENLPEINEEAIKNEIQFSESIANLSNDISLSKFISSHFSREAETAIAGQSYSLLLLSNPKRNIPTSLPPENWVDSLFTGAEQYSKESTFLFIWTKSFSIWFLKSYYLQKLLLYHLTHQENFTFHGFNRSLIPTKSSESLFVLERK